MSKLFLDYAATTPTHPEALKSIKAAEKTFGNPSSSHAFGRAAKELIAQSRADLADTICAKSDQLLFCSGATEANNMVFYHTFFEGLQQNQRVHIITSAIEHKSVLSICKFLRSLGVEITLLPVDKRGRISLTDLENAIKEETRLISIMGVNNEIGTIQPLQEISGIAKKHGIPLHSDCAQWLGKLPLDLSAFSLDFASFSSYKLYGPKGVGALYVKHEEPLIPLIYGGSQERKKRAGTENIPGIVGFSRAATIQNECLESEYTRLDALKKQCWTRIQNDIPDAWVNGDLMNSVPHILNIGIKGIKGESLMMNLDLEGIAVSTGSACSTGSITASHVIQALLGDTEDAHSALRISFGSLTTERDIVRLVAALKTISSRLIP